MGKEFKKELKQLKLSEHKDYEFAYVYPEMPKPDKVHPRTGKILTYVAPKTDVVREHLGPLYRKLEEWQPDMLIPVNSIGSFILTGSKIVKAQGVPVKSSALGKDYWVLPMLSQELISSKPINRPTRALSLSLLQRYLEQGEQVLIPERPEYHELTNIEAVRKVFALPALTGEFGWDLETNTLYSARKGAKPLVLSFAWKEGQSVAIPLEHEERYSATGTTITGDKSCWTPEELEEIYAMLRNLLAAKTVGEIDLHVKLSRSLPPDTPLTKVGHNISYDETFMMNTGHADVFNNVMDTLVGYFLEVRQDTESSRRLSDLSFSFTTIGGYDYPLEDYKKWLKNKVVPAAIKYRKQMIKDAPEKQYTLDYDTDVEGITDEIDWEPLEDYEFSDDPKVREWVIRQIAIPVANRYTSVASVQATLNVSDLGTGEDMNGDFLTYEWIPMEVMAYYAAGDADAALRIHHRLLAMMDNDPRNTDGRIRHLYTSFYPRIVVALSRIQKNGLHVDMDYLDSIADAYDEEQAALDEKIREYPQIEDIESARLELYMKGVEEFTNKKKADRDPEVVKWRDKYKNDAYKFSAGRAADKAQLFYKELGYKLPYDKDFIKPKVWSSHKAQTAITPDDYKVDKTAIKEVAKLAKEQGDEDTMKLMEAFTVYSQVSKIATTYTRALKKNISDKDGCMHGNYSAVGTATSRLSSSNINMQNLPAERSDTTKFSYKYPIKRMFNSRFKDGLMVNIDYANLEFRALGLIANEPSMTEAFLEGKDIHKANAALMYGVPYDEVTKAQRQSSKALGFGIVYGKGVPALAEDIGVSEDEAQEKLDMFFASKPNVKKFIDDTHTFVEQNGYVNTMNGFRRDLAGTFSTDFGIKSKAERQSVNTIIQGSGAILTNTAVILIQDKFRELGMKTVLAATVHDSVLLDAPRDEVHEAIKIALDIMQNLPYDWLFTNYKGERIRYPIEAEAGIGHTYNDMVDYDKEQIDRLGFDTYIEYQEKLKLLSDMNESGQLDKDVYEKVSTQIKALLD